jgi:Uma2 family endonuclease
MIASAPPFRFTVDQYDRMVAKGILTKDNRVELIRGAIVPKMPIGPRHAAVANRLNQLLFPQVQGRAILALQNPIHLPDSEPEPDLAVLHPRTDFYAGGHPQPAQVFLLVEVSDSSLDRDRDRKAPLYAENGIPEYWIVNLDDDEIEIHRKPQPDGTWADATIRHRGDTLNIAALPGVTVAVADILP